jgi:Zn-dependent M28 family amino/carboxypeptidase
MMWVNLGIAEIKGGARPDEYVVLSAHFDSWDSASGATDNGTATLMVLEAMRILKQALPHPGCHARVSRLRGSRDDHARADHDDALARLWQGAAEYRAPIEMMSRFLGRSLRIDSEGLPAFAR